MELHGKGLKLIGGIILDPFMAFFVIASGTAVLI
jgi:hypothetical protein